MKFKLGASQMKAAVECGLIWFCIVQEGDRIGMMRKSNGNLHYFINGLDQGVAATKVPACVWGVVDLYGMTVKVQNQKAGLSSILSTVTVVAPGVLSGVTCCFHNCIMLLQVTIVDRDEREEQNLITRRNTALRDHQILHGLNGITIM